MSQLKLGENEKEPQPWDEVGRPVMVQFMGSQRVGHN